VIVEPEKWTWYVARSGGIVAWLLLAAGLVVGLLLSSKLLGRRVSPAWLLSVHRHLGGLAVVFTAVHVAAVMLDDFVDFGWTDVVVPFASEWRPQAVAWGIVGMYLLVAIELTSLAMRRLPKRLWRVVHWSSAVLFVTATVHGWQAGTDTGRAFMAATVTSIAVLGVLTYVRVVRAARSRGHSTPSGSPDGVSAEIWRSGASRAAQKSRFRSRRSGRGAVSGRTSPGSGARSAPGAG
jgi:DMSO/TMAO reductase YedYZ heme-binding membrane subunit